MTAYRERPPGALDLAPPAPDAPWYEQLAHQVVLAHQPAPRRPARDWRPTPAQVVDQIARYYRPWCVRCSGRVERVASFPSAIDRVTVVHALCHGEHETFEIDDLAIMLRFGKDELADWLKEQLERQVFKVTP